MHARTFPLRLVESTDDSSQEGRRKTSSANWADIPLVLPRPTENLHRSGIAASAGVARVGTLCVSAVTRWRACLPLGLATPPAPGVRSTDCVMRTSDFSVDGNGSFADETSWLASSVHLCCTAHSCRSAPLSPCLPRVPVLLGLPSFSPMVGPQSASKRACAGRLLNEPHFGQVAEILCKGYVQWLPESFFSLLPAAMGA